MLWGARFLCCRTHGVAGDAVSQNEMDLRVGHSQRLDYIVDGSGQEEGVGECPHPLFWGQKVVEFGAKPKSHSLYA